MGNLILDFETFNEDDDKNLSLDIDIDLEDEEGKDLDGDEDEDPNEGTQTIRIRKTPKMMKANKVKAAVSRKLLGDESPLQSQIQKIFKQFKREVRKEAAKQGVPINTINLDKITIRQK